MKAAQFKKTSVIIPIVLPFLIVLFLLILPQQPSTAESTIDPPQSGPIFSVNTTTGTYDGMCGISNCSIRDAIRAANDQGGANTIELGSGLFYTLTVVDNGLNGLPLVTSTITLNGHGSTIARSTAGGTPIFRLFETSSQAVLRLNQVTVSNGRALWPSYGGGIFSQGTLTVSESTLADNDAGNDGGGIYAAGPTYVLNSTFIGNDAGNGGGIEIYAFPLTVANSTFYNNSATSRGGGIDSYTGQVTIINSTFSGNNGFTSFGGGVNNNQGSMTLRNNILSNNASNNCGWNIVGITDGGGNLYWPSSDTSCPGTAGNPLLSPLADNGGETQTMALGAGSAAIDAGNDATCAAWPVNNRDQRVFFRPIGSHCDIGAFEYEVPQSGPNFTVNTTSGVDGGECGATHCTLREAIHAANDQPGANTIELGTSLFYTLTEVDNSINGLPVVASNITINGHGSTIARSTAGGTPQFRLFFVDYPAKLTLDNLKISNGYAYNDFGGGIMSDGTLTLTNSTVINNYATQGGGGIYAAEPTHLSACTFVGNGTAGFGGGVVYDHTNGSISNCTFTENTGLSSSAAIEIWSSSVDIINSTVYSNSGAAAIYGGNLKNTIIANNSPSNCQGSTDGGNNLRWPLSDTSCVGTFGDPKLLPLADNGGKTQTMALGDGSAAIDAGNVATCAAWPVNSLDQRGVTRPQGSQCDIGAFEESAQLGLVLRVNTTAGTDDGLCSYSNCTLREAIHLANNQVGANTIELETDEFYTLTLVDNGINGLPLVTSTITIEGDGATIARSTTGSPPSFRLFQVDSQGVLGLNQMTLTNGYAPDPYYGGAIFSYGTLTVSESTLSGNYTYNDGGGIYAAGPTYVLNSTLSGNSAFNGGGIEIYAYPLFVINSTFGENGASSKGGGIDNYQGQATVIHSTFSGNSAATGGALKCTSCTLFDLRSSIFDTNTSTNCSGGGFTDSGGNLRWPSSDASCPGTAGDPKLSALADNGGSTQTMALQPGSAALSHGVPAYCTADMPDGAGGRDQRGFPRAETCDSGAFEAYTIYLPLIRR